MTISALSPDAIPTIATRVAERMTLRDDGTIAVDWNAERLGTSDEIAQALGEAFDHLNEAIRAGVISVDRDFHVQLTPQAAEALHTTAWAPAEETNGWLELSAGWTDALIVCLGGTALAAAIAGLTAILLGAIAFVGGAYGVALKAGIIAAIAAYIFVNAVWLSIKVEDAQKASFQRGVKLRFRVTHQFLDIFIAHQVEVEPL